MKVALIGLNILFFWFAFDDFAFSDASLDLLEKKVKLAVVVKNRPNPSYSLRERMKNHHVPGMSIAVIEKGKIATARAYGVIDSISKEPVTIGTRFQAASLSKPVTALAILRLVQNGKLDLDQNIQSYLTSWKIPESNLTKNEKVTLRRILSHRAGLNVSGFPGYIRGTRLPSLLDILNGNRSLTNTEAVKVQSVPGSEWSYSGGGYTVLQQLIEDITHVTFSQFMKTEVFIPLGMDHSDFEIALSSELPSFAASGHQSDGRPVPKKRHLYPESAAAGLWSTPSDLARMIVAIQKCALKEAEQSLKNWLSPALCKEMLTPQNGPTGLGFFVSIDEKLIHFSHAGWNYGFISNLKATLPASFTASSADTTGSIVMTNSFGGSSLIPEIERTLEDSLGIKRWTSIEKEIFQISPHLLKRYEGSYENKKDPQHPVEISLVDQTLLMKMNSEWPSTQFFPEACNQFFAMDGSILRFEKDSATLTLPSDQANGANHPTMTFGKKL